MKHFLFFYIFFLVSIFSNSTFAKEIVDKIAASVNDEVILLSDLNNMRNRANKPGALYEPLLLNESLEALKSDPKAQLNFLIREKLVESEIRRLGMSISNEQSEAAFAMMAKKNQLSLGEFKNYLNSQGYTPEEYKQILKKQSECQAFFEKEIINKLRITDEDAYAVYRSKFPNSHATIGEFKISQIFFSIKNGGASGAQSRASAALNRLRSGESFESLANQLDETPGSNTDGVLGSFKSGEFLPEIEAAIADLSIGSASEVLRGPNGFHIVKLLDKKTVPDPNFVRVKESIKASLVQQNFERQLKNWFEFKKLQSNIKVYNSNK